MQNALPRDSHAHSFVVAEGGVMRLTQDECARKLADWLIDNAGYVYNTGSLRGFGIGGEVDLMDLAIFVLDTLAEPAAEAVRSA